MKITERSVKAWLSHLRRHPLPELIDDECLAALESIEAQYGDVITHGAGLEIRLSEEACYADYIMNIDVDSIPYAQSLWYEIDCAEFKKAAATGKTIAPCLFMNINATEAENENVFWDAVLPSFLGEARAKKTSRAAGPCAGAFAERSVPQADRYDDEPGRDRHHAYGYPVPGLGEYRPQSCSHRLAG